MTAAQIVAWLGRAADAIEREKDNLTALDAAIGDADHGINMHRGFQKVKALLPTLDGKDIGAILKAVGMGLIGSVGGASGPLYGTFFLRAAAAAGAAAELSPTDLARVFKAAVDGVAERGKAQAGDKTMLDALIPAADAMQQSATGGADDAGVLRAGLAAAEAGLQSTIPLVARKGRASYLGERSKGHPDPGATSACLLLRECDPGRQ